MIKPPHCHHCKSTNFKESIIMKSGIQRYFCMDCNRSFQGEYKNKSLKPLECPHCNTTMIPKKSGRGKNIDIVPRYKCTNCNRTFQTIYQKKFSRSFPLLQCRHCKASKYHRMGHEKENKRYHCLECDRTFQEHYKPVIPITIKCKNCRSNKIVRNGKLNEIQKYKCKKCKKVFMETYKTLKKK